MQLFPFCAILAADRKNRATSGRYKPGSAKGGIRRIFEMSMIDSVRAAMVTAMKAHDKESKESLSMLLSALKNKQIDKREDLTEAEEFEVVK